MPPRAAFSLTPLSACSAWRGVPEGRGEAPPHPSSGPRAQAEPRLPAAELGEELDHAASGDIEELCALLGGGELGLAHGAGAGPRLERAGDADAGGSFVLLEHVGG